MTGLRTLLVALFVLLVIACASVLMFRASTAPPHPPDATVPSRVTPPPAPSPAPEPPPPPKPAPPPLPKPETVNPGKTGTGFGRGGRAGQPAPTPIADRFDEVDAALGALVQGRIAFNTPERMRYGDSQSIALVASPSMDADTLSTELRNRIGGADPIEIATLQIAPLMEARLEGAPAFEVTALTPVQQPVSRSAPTEWRWTVRAAETGRHQLHLTINAVITVAGERFPRSLDVLNRDIEVEITAGQRISMFIGANWQWLLGTVIIPLALWRWNQQRKTRKRRS
jgi:hypothetical protein